jgi:hypothetical protein
VCTASPGYLASVRDQLPDDVKAYTEEGTLAHEIASKLLLGQALPSKVSKDILKHVKQYAAFIHSQQPETGSDLVVEQAVQVFYNPEKDGYVDAAIIHHDGSCVHIIDLKFGRGVSVQADNNPQLSIYAKGLIDRLNVIYGFKPDTIIKITIWQPRVRGEEAERTWVTDLDTLNRFTQFIGSVAADIHANPFKQTFSPNDHVCQFCAAAAICPARADNLLNGVESGTKIVTVPRFDKKQALPAPETLSREVLGQVLAHAKSLKKWLDQVETYAELKMIQHNETIPGFKVVASRPHRRWKDEADAINTLEFELGLNLEDFTETSIITPAKVEELLKTRRTDKKMWDAFNDLVFKPDGQPTLAPVTDKRPSLLTSAEDEFEVVEETSSTNTFEGHSDLL